MVVSPPALDENGQGQQVRVLQFLETTKILDSALDRFDSEQLSWVDINTCSISKLPVFEEEFLLIGLCEEN